MPGAPGRSGGRNATPPALRVVQGNRGKRRVRPSPTPPIDHDHAPDEPQWSELLPGDANEEVRRHAAAEWDRVVPVLDVIKLLATIDLTLLTDYCLTWARLLQCERALALEGLVLEVHQLDKDGNRVRTDIRRNPLSVTVKEYRSALRAYIAELGLGPSARGRIALPGAGTKNRWEDLL